MLTKYIALDTIPLAFRNRLKSTEKEYAAVLSHAIFAQCLIQNKVIQGMCDKVVLKLLSLTDEAQEYALTLGWCTPQDLQLLKKPTPENISELSSQIPTTITKLYLSLTKSQQLPLAEKYCQRLLTPEYIEHLAQRFSLSSSHIFDIVVGQIYPIARLEAITSAVQLLIEKYNCTYTTALRIAKANTRPQEKIIEIEKNIEQCLRLYPTVSPSDIKYVCLEYADPQAKIEQTLPRTTQFAAAHQITESLAFWYILRFRDPEKKLLADTLTAAQHEETYQLPHNYAIRTAAHNDDPRKALIALLRLRNGDITSTGE